MKLRKVMALTLAGTMALAAVGCGIRCIYNK